MKDEKGSTTPGILPVPRSKEDAKRFYDRISQVYDYFTAAFEGKYAEKTLELFRWQKKGREAGDISTVVGVQISQSLLFHSSISYKAELADS